MVSIFIGKIYYRIIKVDINYERGSQAREKNQLARTRPYENFIQIHVSCEYKNV